MGALGAALGMLNVMELTAGGMIVDVDINRAMGQLSTVTSASRVYIIKTATGAAM